MLIVPNQHSSSFSVLLTFYTVIICHLNAVNMQLNTLSFHKCLITVFSVLTLVSFRDYKLPLSFVSLNTVLYELGVLCPGANSRGQYSDNARCCKL